jgi:hypothetical protein
MVERLLGSYDVLPSGGWLVVKRAAAREHMTVKKFLEERK